METFLGNLAKQLKQQYAGHLENVAVILPTQRNKRVLARKLTEGEEKPVFLPALFTINDFMESFLPYEKISQIEALTELYNVNYLINNNKKDEKQEDFSHFLSWGTQFLTDINDIDMQLQNADDIFANLSNIKELDLTLFKSMSESSKRKAMLDFYCSLRELYHRYSEALLSKNLAYEGLIYRKVAENIADLSQRYSFDAYVFAGFNALSPAELKVIKFYKEKRNGTIVFDLNPFYYDENIPTSLTSFPKSVSDFIHLAAKELNLKKEEVTMVSHGYRDIPKHVTVAGVSRQMNQVRYAVQRLQEIKKEHPDSLDDTAVVLADESLVVPFVHACDCADLNLTMGYPLSGLQAYGLLTLLLRLLKSARENTTAAGETSFRFYHADLLAFLQHPLVMAYFLKANDRSSLQFEKEFGNQHYVYLSAKNVGEMMKKALQKQKNASAQQLSSDFEAFLEQFSKNATAPLKVFIQFFNLLLERMPDTEAQRGALQMMAQEMETMHAALAKLPPVPISADSLSQLLTLQLGNQVVPMAGNAEHGVQVMGLLETRLLDFRNLIVLSVNEGVLPQTKSQSSLILQDVKHYFHLPTYYERDAVFTYHFYRLLQRASNIWLVYDNDSSDSVAEKSRLVNLLQFEVNKQQLTDTIVIEEQCVNVVPDFSSHASISSVKKDAQLMQELKDFTFSATTLITYIQCPLQFYFKHLKKIKPYKKAEDEIDRVLLGVVIHAFLKNLVNRCREDFDNAAKYTDELSATLETELTKIFADNQYDEEQLQRGKPYLMYDVAQRYLKAYLTKFKKELPRIREFMQPELELNTQIIVNEDIKANFTGTIDRTEWHVDDGGLHILDYKTGKVEDKKLSFNEELSIEDNLKEVMGNPEWKQAFQLLCYALLYQENESKKKKDKSEEKEAKPKFYHCGIVSLQNAVKTQEEKYLFNFSPAIDKDLLQKFKAALVNLFTEIYNQKCEFGQTPEPKNCTRCDFKAFCMR